jgi:endoglucanase Acf2
MKKIMILTLLAMSFLLVGCADDLTTNTSTDLETTSIATTERITTENVTTAELATSEIDTSIITTYEETSLDVITPIITTGAPSTMEPTTIEPTTMEPTTTEPTTMEPTTMEPTTEEVVDTIGMVSGIEDQDVIVNHYFDPLMNVSAFSSIGEDITQYINVLGHVDYGTLGDYSLTYQINYNDDVYTNTVTVSVINGVYSEPAGSRPETYDGSINVYYGSYYTGANYNIEHPMTAQYFSDYLLDSAVPTSSWWTHLLTSNYGGENGIYTNPLRTAFSNSGMEITNPLDGFVQYWNVDGNQTIAQFPIALKDTFIKSSDLNLGYVTKVIGYSDSMVKVAMKNSLDGEDEMVVTLVQGSPYIFVETANKNALSLTMDGGVLIEYYNLYGQQITNDSYQGDAIIVKMVQRHSGYDTSPPANVGQPQYTDKYYLVNAPSNSTFYISSNVLSMSLGDGNYLSIAAINDLSEAVFYHSHGYTIVTDTTIDYRIDYEDSLVFTDYHLSIQLLRNDLESKPLLALMPHHYKYSDVLLTDYSYRTVRGTLKVMEGHHFQTVLSFNGLLPGYTLPDGDSFDSTLMISYLMNLDDQTEIDDLENFLNAEGPYWNGKALYPLSQGLMIADQLGEEELKQSFIDKLNYLLTDWYSYSAYNDEKYLYYNNDWGTVYYSNNDFNTATSLSDHSFTHGYLIYASSVLAMYDESFKEGYGEIVELLLNDYMYPYKDDADFAYLRNFDPWAGHSWAHGIGGFAEGNNLESTSEALNSWNAGYLWALSSGDQDRMEAAIYGFVTEISAVKEYWFDFDEENWDPAFGDYVDVVGILWGGKHDYATWFGANPTFIYGIQWLPTGEYLTNYALNDDDYLKFSSIYQTYLDAKNGEVDTWFSNMWAIQAIIDPDIAINEFDATLILNDDYPAELSGTYWMIHALDALGRRTTDVWMGIELGVASTIYKDDFGQIYAMIWNSSDEEKTVHFYDESGLFSTQTVSANTFIKIELN